MLTSRFASMGEINVKRLGQQQKDTLRFLYQNRDKVHQQVDIIESIYEEVTNSRKASMSRTVNNLMDTGLVDSRQAYYSERLEANIKQRVRYFITEEGEKFLEEDSRFPNISAEEEPADTETDSEEDSTGFALDVTIDDESDAEKEETTTIEMTDAHIDTE